MSLAVRHNQLARVSGVVMLPKHLIFIHLTIFIKHTGNPKYFANFLDESLNSILKSIAQGVHRLTWERSIFCRVRLLPTVAETSAFAEV